MVKKYYKFIVECIVVEKYDTKKRVKIAFDLPTKMAALAFIRSARSMPGPRGLRRRKM
jgi:hypothetical protein